MFLAGLVTGLALAGAATWLVALRDPDHTVGVTAVGADVTRAGGAKVVVRNRGGSVTQTCNGVCDDLRIEARGGDDSYEVRVLDQAGASIASGGQYVTPGRATELTVAGAPELTIGGGGKSPDRPR